MLTEIKQSNPKFYKFINNILGMDFFDVCKGAILQEEELYPVLLESIWCLEQNEASFAKSQTYKNTVEGDAFEKKCTLKPRS